MLAKLLRESFASLVPATKRHEGEDSLPGDRIFAPDDSGLGDLRVRDERGFDLRRRDAMPGDLHDVVDATHEPEVAFLIATRSVAGEVLPGIAAPVGLAVALVVLVDTAEHRGPRPRKDEIPRTTERHRLALLVHDVGLYAGERERRTAGFGRRQTGQRGDQDHPRLGHPPGVDDRAASAAD